jgi:hypothetical protein
MKEVYRLQDFGMIITGVSAGLKGLGIISNGILLGILELLPVVEINILPT